MEISQKEGRERERGEKPSSVSPTKHAFSLDCIDSNRRTTDDGGRVGWTTDGRWTGSEERGSDKTENGLAKMRELTKHVQGSGLKRLRKCCRQGQTEMVSKSSNKIHKTKEPPFSRALYV